MAALIYLDTHVAAWLFAGRTGLLTPGARQLLDESDLLISPAVVLELQYLFEIRRVEEPAAVVVEALGRDLGVRVCTLPFYGVVEVALGQSWTRDPFDRLIASQAMLRDLPLLTRDGDLRDHCHRAVWP